MGTTRRKIEHRAHRHLQRLEQRSKVALYISWLALPLTPATDDF